MKPNSMSKILVFGVFVLFLLSLGACNIKSLGVQIGEEPGPVVVAKSKGGPPPHAPAAWKLLQELEVWFQES